MKNAPLAELFHRTADVLAIQGENSFRILAYRKIARTLEDLPHDIATLAASEDLDNTPGIGESSAAKIREYLKTGHIAEFEELWSEIPPGVMDMMKIPSVGPKTAALLWHEGNITSVPQLLESIDKKTVPEIKGIGEKKLEKIKQSIAYLAQSTGRIRLGTAYALAQNLLDYLRQIPGVTRAEYCGSLRRGRETIGDIDIALAADPKLGPAISKKVLAHPSVAETLAAGDTKTSFRTSPDLGGGGGGVQVDVRVVPPESFGAALQYFTGSLAHNVKLRERAVKKGLKLNEWGLFKGDKLIAGKTEEEIYQALDLAWMPPELREDRGEFETFKLAAKPHFEILELSHIRGDLHMHTTASDGSRSIEEMVAECKRRGYQYCAITDHSKSQFQANGLRSDRLLDHIKAIHAVAKQVKGILVLAGSEVDILADGSLDYEDELLAQLDWVVASPHAALSQETEPATTRLMHAIANPHVCVIGHPTGRLVPTRRGLEPDMKRVVFAAARAGVALEINANCHRLDLRDTHAQLAVEAKVPLCINTDAHAFEDMDEMLFGILTARRGWAQPKDVLNTRPVEAFTKWLKARKSEAGW